MTEKPKRLGRGLAALIGDMATIEAERPADANRGIRRVAVGSLTANRRNPRHEFDSEQLAELTESIREKGVMQPLLVRPAGLERFEIIAGERRWRAARASISFQ